MFKNAVVNFALNHLPRESWNQLSTICASISAPVIEEPISFAHREFTLHEFTMGDLSPDIEERFLDFCYPADLPDRQRQIEYDKHYYWPTATTFLVFDKCHTIVGCVQVIHRNASRILPVEFAQAEQGGSTFRFDLSNVYDSGSLTEIYRCRRSFNLCRFEGVNVLLMLFKATFAHVISTRTAFSFVSYDASRNDLHHLYTSKLDFHDTGILLRFPGNETVWRLAQKDWFQHEKKYASKGKTQFFLQTWARSGLRHKHISHGDHIESYLHDSNLLDAGKIVFAETVTSTASSQNRTLIKPD